MHNARPSRLAPGAPAAGRGLWRRAFTLVEVLVVMMIIAILSMLTIPRLIGSQSRAAEVEAIAVRTLLSQAAQQDSVTSTSLAISYDHEKQELSLQTTVEKEGKREWAPMPLVRSVRFSSSVLADASADGQTQGQGANFRIEFVSAKPRPVVSLLVKTAPDLPGTPRAWQIDLLPGQTVATVRSVGAEAPIAQPESTSIDLDANGQRTQPW